MVPNLTHLNILKAVTMVRGLTAFSRKTHFPPNSNSCKRTAVGHRRQLFRVDVQLHNFYLFGALVFVRYSDLFSFTVWPIFILILGKHDFRSLVNICCWNTCLVGYKNLFFRLPIASRFKLYSIFEHSFCHVFSESFVAPVDVQFHFCNHSVLLLSAALSSRQMLGF